MLRKILTYGLIEGLAKGLNKLIFFVLPYFVFNINDYGYLVLLITIEFILPFITLMGFEKAVLRFVSDSQEPENIKSTVFSAVTFLHFFILLCLATLYIFDFLKIQELLVFPDIFMIVLLVYLQGVNNIFLNIYRVEGNHQKYFRTRLFLQVSKIVLVCGFLFLIENYMGYIYGASVAALISLFLFNGELKRYIHQFNKDTFAFLFHFSWPFVLHSVCLNLIGNLDKFLISYFLDFKYVGIYTFAYAFGSMISFAFLGITVYIEPLIYKKEVSALQRSIILDKFLVLSLSGGVLFFILLNICNGYVLPLLYNDNFQSSFAIIPLISSAFLFQPYYLKSNYKLIYQKKTKAIALISFIGMILNLVLNYILIPEYGINAAVYTTLISNFLQYLVFVIIANSSVFVEEVFRLLFLGTCLSIILLLNFNVFLILIPILIEVTYISYKRKFFSLGWVR